MLHFSRLSWAVLYRETSAFTASYRAAISPAGTAALFVIMAKA
jgi:hypothetical protein